MHRIFFELAVMRNSCVPLLHPTNGVVRMSGTAPGDTGVYFCTVGNMLIDVQNVMCLNNGTWSDIPPICPTDGMDIICLMYMYVSYKICIIEQILTSIEHKMRYYSICIGLIAIPQQYHSVKLKETQCGRSCGLLLMVEVQPLCFVEMVYTHIVICYCFTHNKIQFSTTNGRCCTS